jgi:hypothetical protein
MLMRGRHSVPNLLDRLRRLWLRLYTGYCQETGFRRLLRHRILAQRIDHLFCFS